MKKYYLKRIGIVLLLLNTQAVWAQQENYTVSGKIKGLDAGMMFITTRDSTLKGGFRRDSIKINNETFSYTAPIKEMTMISISPGIERVVKRAGRGYYPVKSSLLQFMASPGAKIKFSGKITDFVDAYPSGDAANDDFAKLNKIVFPMMKLAKL